MIEPALFLLPLAVLLLLAPLWPVFMQWQFPATQSLPETSTETDWAREALDAQEATQTAFADLITMTERDGVIRGADEDGIPFLVLGARDHLANHLPANATRLRMMLVSSRHLDIPGELICDRLVFARNRLHIAHNAIVKTALAGRDAVIGPRARVRRWLHAGVRVDVAEGAQLAGCISAGHELVLARRTRFEKLLAPCIRFGRQAAPRTPVPTTPQILMQTPSHAWLPGDGRWIINGDLSIPPGHRLNAQLIVHGSLLVGTGSVLRGNIRVMGDLILHHEAQLGGSVLCDGDMQTGDYCLLAGPVQAGGRLQAGYQCSFGTQSQPTTVSARDIRMGEACIVHGAIQAMRRGEVLSDSHRNDAT